MIGALSNVAQAETKSTGKAAKASEERAVGFPSPLGEIQLIKGLVLVAARCRDLNCSALRDQTIDKVDADAALVIVLENQFAMAAARRQGGSEAYLDFAGALLHIVDRREAGRDQMKGERLAIRAKRKVFKDALCVSVLLGC